MNGKKEPEPDYGFLVDAAKILDEQKVPTEGRMYWGPETNTVKKIE